MQDGVATHFSSDEPRIGTFNALLWSLLSSGLLIEVEPGDPALEGVRPIEPAVAEGVGRWRLTPAAQRRLDELARRRIYQPESLVYLDHRCAACGERRPTRLRAGHYLCETCQRRETVHSDPLPIRRQGRFRRGRSRRRDREGR